MNNYTTKQIPNSISGLVLIGGVLIALTPSADVKVVEERLYKVNSTSSSFYTPDSYSLGSTDSLEVFTTTLSSFYEELENDQEPLGDEFLKILNENIWDLYES